MLILVSKFSIFQSVDVDDYIMINRLTMPESDFDAELEQLSRQQKEKYDALVKDFEQQKEKVLESLINNDFDSVKARAELESH